MLMISVSSGVTNNCIGAAEFIIRGKPQPSAF
jgi:hypothetical protein